MDERLRDPKIATVTIGLLAFGLGTGLGYILGRRQRKFIHAVPAQDWSLADLEVVDGEKETDEVIDVEIAKALEAGRSFIDEKLNSTTEEPVHKTIFEENGDLPVWNWEEETSKRTEQEPYILYRDEFFTDEREYSQSTLTYYAGDDILVDQENTPIYNHSTILGPLLFGYGSGDPNTVYVRNDKLRAEYEIIRDPGLYSVEVLGMEIEENARTTDLQHSADRKFRQD